MKRLSTRVENPHREDRSLACTIYLNETQVVTFFVRYNEKGLRDNKIDLLLADGYTLDMPNIERKKLPKTIVDYLSKLEKTAK